MLQRSEVKRAHNNCAASYPADIWSSVERGYNSSPWSTA